MFEIKNCIVDGIRCAYHDSAPQQTAQAVVFVHGNPGPMDDWEQLLPPISRFCRVIAMDMPGFGRSERPSDFDYSIPGYARFLGALLDQLQVQRVHLVLHDFGGAWGLCWVLDHPQRLASLTLINCGIMEGYHWHWMARFWQVPVLGELLQLSFRTQTMQTLVNRANPNPLPAAFSERVRRYADWGNIQAVVKLYRSARDPRDSFPPLQANPDAAKLPVCVIWGAADPFLPVKYAGQQRRYFPAAEVHELAGLGHWPFYDDLQAVLTPLDSFLHRQVNALTIKQAEAVNAH